MAVFTEPALPPTVSLSPRSATSDPPWIRVCLVGAVVVFLGVLFVLPLVLIFQEALRKGWAAYLGAFADEEMHHAIGLTLQVAAIAVPLNTVFGLAAAWLVARFRFTGSRWLAALIELPLWVSPVITGMSFVLLFGSQGLLGDWLAGHGVKVIFALPGLVLGTLFVTFPFVARVLTPQMQALGRAGEEAALTLGAGPWRVFWSVTLPKVKWSLTHGIILCSARAMGEFGAVSVLSGHIRGATNTLPLHIEVLYNEYQFVPAFAAASLLALLAVFTLILKNLTATAAAGANPS